MLLGPLLTHPLMTALSTPAEIYGMSCTYLTIVFLGILGCAYYNILSGILRGLGDSVTPLLFLLLACGLNIVLDILFVAVFHWDVMGVALVTIISQALSAALRMVRFCRMKKAHWM